MFSFQILGRSAERCPDRAAKTFPRRNASRFPVKSARKSPNKNAAKSPVKSARMFPAKSARMCQNKNALKFPRKSALLSTFAKYVNSPLISAGNKDDRAFRITNPQTSFPNILRCYSKSTSSTSWLNVLMFSTKIAIASNHNVEMLAKYKFKLMEKMIVKVFCFYSYAFVKLVRSIGFKVTPYTTLVLRSYILSAPAGRNKGISVPVRNSGKLWSERTFCL